MDIIIILQCSMNKRIKLINHAVRNMICNKGNACQLQVAINFS